MDRTLQRIITLNAWFVFLHYFTSNGMSTRVQHVASNTNYDSNPGFISIDCGAEKDYMDEETGIWYQADKEFIETGTSHGISPSADLNYPYFGKQLNTLRSFPDGKRNCYSLKPKQSNNSNYLIRAFFAYGNYDGQNKTSVFDLYLGVNYWETVGPGPDTDYTYTEIIQAPSTSTETINVCLVNTGQGIPYISTLELRPVSSLTYPLLSNSESLLYSHTRFDVGASASPLHSRYKDDVYDRIWRSFQPNDWHSFGKSVNFDPRTTNDVYKLPVEVWRTAVTSSNGSHELEFNYDLWWKALDKSSKYFVFFHFVEMEQLPAGKKRIINITLNDDNILSEPLVLDYLKPISVSNKNATQGKIHFKISTTSESDAPPILSAFEPFRLITQLSSPTNARDVVTIMNIKSMYKVSTLNWQGDPCVPYQFAWEGLICSKDINPRITSLNLSSSQLTGKIDASFSYLTELESLDLSHNDLMGPIPEFFAELPKLKFLNLSGNKLSGTIPKALKEKADTNNLQLSLDDNPGLCIMDSCEKRNFIVPLVASISALIVVLSISVGICIFKRRKQVVCSKPELRNGGSLKSKNRAFTYAEVLSITENFKNIIGEGGFGKVYHGILQDHTQVAVKLLSQSSMQGYKEFQSEAQLLMIVYHRNLVSLIGYCDEGETKALIYEYMVNGNLQQLLSAKNPYILKWNERLQIAVDAAQGLDYLHNGCRPPLVHRDLKTSNILLNENMQAKIADFGLCRAFQSDIDSHISTCPAGTPGYVDPEFQRTGNSNKKSDVYSFGIILFELITGQPAVARSEGKLVQILEWVIPIVQTGDIKNIIDPRLQGEFNTNTVWKAVEIALSCISPTAAERPDICHIWMELKECLSLQMIQTYVKRSSSILEMTGVRFESDIVPLAR